MQILRRLGRVAVLGSLLLLSACAVNPATGENDFVLMSEAEEGNLGRTYNQQILEQQPVYNDPKVQAYVRKIGLRVAKGSHRSHLNYQFTVIDSPDINAFALPGGYIYIHRGLMAHLNSEAELAAVLAHEVGHVTARHSVRQHSASMATNVLAQVVSIYAGGNVANLANLAGTALVRGYGREHELEADGFGAQYLANAGYSPQAMIEVIEVLKAQQEFSQMKARASGKEVASYHGLFSTHPRNDERLMQVVGQVPVGAQGDVGRLSYLRVLDGMSYGDSAAQGILRGNSFYHGELNLKLTMPRGWEVQNQAEQLVAQAPGEEAMMVMQLGEIKDGYTPEEYLRSLIGTSTQRSGKDLKLKGMRGYSAIIKPASKPALRLAIVFHGGKVLQFFAGAKDEGQFDLYDQQALSALNSLSTLNKADKVLAKGRHIYLEKVPKGASYSRYARRSGLGQYAETELRLINDHYPRGQLQAGQWLKVLR